MNKIQITVAQAKRIINEFYVQNAFVDYLKNNHIALDKYTDEDIIQFVTSIGYTITCNDPMDYLRDTDTKYHIGDRFCSKENPKEHAVITDMLPNSDEYCLTFIEAGTNRQIYGSRERAWYTDRRLEQYFTPVDR